MLTFIFAICLIAVFGKLFLFALRAAWGLTRILFSIVLLPLVLIGMVLAGLMYLAFPILILIGIVTLVKSLAD